MSPTPYNINVPQEALDRLQQKLTLTTWPDELDATDQWPYGAPLADVKRLATYWKDEFDWRRAETQLNQLPNYKEQINVDGFGDIDIHFVWQKSNIPGAIPLLFSHGWPGSFIEVTKLLPLLQGSSSAPAFDIVAPSLPNYGFSGVVRKPGFKLAQYAEVCHKLMLSLGYNQYVTQGGDWGFYVTRCMAILYPDHCLANHVNMVRAFEPTFKRGFPLLALKHRFLPYTQEEKAGLARGAWFGKEGSGYNREQATKPQTLGYALTDSPVALLAWIYEKLHDWTDNYPWTEDEILTWISIYLFSTAGPAANVRIYYEAHHTDPSSKTTREAVHDYVPHTKLGLAYFPRELGSVPQTWGRTMGNVVYESGKTRGGHFAAWEEPQEIAGDLSRMFGKGGPCFGIVKGRSGFKEDRAKL